MGVDSRAPAAPAAPAVAMTASASVGTSSGRTSSGRTPSGRTPSGRTPPAGRSGGAGRHEEVLRVVVQKACRAPGIPSAARIHEWIRAALEGVLSGEVTVRVIGEAESAHLNSVWRGKRGATNVLSFPAEIPAGAPAGADVDDRVPESARAAHSAGPRESSECLPAGDIAVCAPVLEREAAEQGKALQAHWTHIVIHGALHLAGFDHETSHEAEVMEARERELLAGFGIADPYTEACKPPRPAAR